MTIISIEFLLFLTFIVGTYYMIPHRYRWVLLLLASYVFYATLSVQFIPLLLISTAFTYVIGILIEKQEKKEQKNGSCGSVSRCSSSSSAGSNILISSMTRSVRSPHGADSIMTSRIKKSCCRWRFPFIRSRPSVTSWTSREGSRRRSVIMAISRSISPSSRNLWRVQSSGRKNCCHS